MPLPIFADGSDAATVPLPLWVVVVLALCSSTGPVYLGVKAAGWAWRKWVRDKQDDRQFDSAERREARDAEAKQEAVGMTILKSHVRGLEQRLENDRVECNERIAKQDARIDQMTERLLTTEKNNGNLGGWVRYYQSLVHYLHPDLKFDIPNDPAAAVPQPPPAPEGQP